MLKAVLHTISIWIVVVPFLLGILNMKHLNRDARWIFMLVSVSLVPQLATAILQNDHPAFNLIYNVYTPMEFFILYHIFSSKFQGRSRKRIVRGSSLFYVLTCLIAFGYYSLWRRFVGELVVVNNLIYMLWILLLLEQEYAEDHRLIYRRNPFTWLLIALIFYAPCSLITLALYQYIRDPLNPGLAVLKFIQDVFNILEYMLISVGLILRNTKQFI